MPLNVIKSFIKIGRGASVLESTFPLLRPLRRRQGPTPQEEQGQTTSSLLSSFFRSCPAQLLVLQAFCRSALPVWIADPSERRNHTCH
jgi:hypothetical protein